MIEITDTESYVITAEWKHSDVCWQVSTEKISFKPSEPGVGVGKQSSLDTGFDTAPKPFCMLKTSPVVVKQSSTELLHRITHVLCIVFVERQLCKSAVCVHTVQVGNKWNE